MGFFLRRILSLYVAARLLVILIGISSNTCLAQAQSFKCSATGSRSKCDSIIDYLPPNTTTLAAIKTLFNVRNLRQILGANNLSSVTPPNFQIRAKQRIKIRFPCICSNGTGMSYKRPYYTVLPGDSLSHIATEIFGGLVTYQQIQAANNISNPNVIQPGQRLLIPLPCSCDDVAGEMVVHYGHVVAAGSTVDGIARQFNVSQDTLLKLNNLASPKDLLAGAVLDVPLRACSSSISNTSRDYPLLVPNDNYVFTANNCVKCACATANNWMLQCESSLINSSCSPILCQGSENLFLGNTTTLGCNRTTCAYAGYTTAVLTTTTSELTCPASDNNSSTASLQGGSWYQVLIFVHLVLLWCSIFK